MTRLVYVNETAAARRRVYFHLVNFIDGMSPEVGEAGGQPELSLDGAAWTTVGVGTLVAIGNGRYYCEVAQSVYDTVGRVIESRYKSINTAECPGDSIVVVPWPATGAGAIPFTYTVTNSVTLLPVGGVDVWVSTDVAGLNVVAGTLQTDAAGQVLFYLDAGTYYFWRQKTGWSGVNPDVEVVS